MPDPTPLLGEDAQYRLLVEQVSDYGIFLLDPEGRVNTWNEGARRLKGYEAHEILGRHFSVFYPPEDVAADKPGRGLAEALRQGRAEDEGWRVRKDGSRFWANAILTPLRDPGGHLKGFAKVTRDFSGRRGLEEALRKAVEELRLRNAEVERANRMKSDFLAGMSHELRTPLNSILGFSEILQDGKAGPVTDLQKEFLGDVLSGARRLLQLINDLLDLSKIEAGQFRLRMAAFDPGELLRRCADLLRPMAEQRALTLRVELEPDLPAVMADPDRMEQVLQNFLSNAFKFAPAASEVLLRARRQEDRLRLEVQDHGIGIGTEDQARLFADFMQLDAGMAKRHHGTGLGLALCRKIAEAHGGAVGVESVLGHGSLFYVEVPTGKHGAVVFPPQL